MDLILPKLGEGADSGVVVNVFVKEGDAVAKDQAVIELENEKAVASIPSTVTGVVAKIFVKLGDKISVGQRILSLGEGGGAGTAIATKPAAKRVIAAPEPKGEDAAEVISEPELAEPVAAPVASPSLRRMARELGIELRKIRGRGPGGRIELSDLRGYIQRLERAASKGEAVAATSAVAAPAKPAAEQIDFSKWGPSPKSRSRRCARSSPGACGKTGTPSLTLHSSTTRISRG